MKAAIIAAVVAMIVSASAATAATLITGRQIKDGSIGLVDLSAKAKKALKASGGLDPAKISYVQGQPVMIAPESFGTANVKCPAGTKAISGGWGNVGPDDSIHIDGNSSLDSGGSWTFVVYNYNEDSDATVTPFAVCVAR
jgi:hypothetical protein